MIHEGNMDSFLPTKLNVWQYEK